MLTRVAQQLNQFLVLRVQLFDAIHLEFSQEGSKLLERLFKLACHTIKFFCQP